MFFPFIFYFMVFLTDRLQVFHIFSSSSLLLLSLSPLRPLSLLISFFFPNKSPIYYHIDEGRWRNVCHGGLHFMYSSLPPACFHKYFRFTYQQLQIILPKVGIPLETSEKLPGCCRYKVPFVVGFLIMLSRLSCPRFLRPDLELLWGLDKSVLSKIVSASLKWFYDRWHHALGFQSDRITPNIRLYADAIGRTACMPLPSACQCFGFVDGTFR